MSAAFLFLAVAGIGCGVALMASGIAWAVREERQRARLRRHLGVLMGRPDSEQWEEHERRRVLFSRCSRARRIFPK